MTLWIGAAALVTMILMFVLGLSRGQSAESLFITAIALAIAAIPTALPTVLQVDPLRRRQGSGRGEGHRQGPGLRGDARLHLGHQLGQDGHADDEPGDRRRGARRRRPLHRLGHRLRPRRAGAARGRHLALHRRRHPPVHRHQRRQARERQGRRRPHRGRPAGARPQGRAGHRRQPRALPAPHHPAVRPRLQAHGHVLLRHRRLGQERRALLRQGRGAGRVRPHRDGPRQRRDHAAGRRPQEEGGRRCGPHGRRGPPGDGRSRPRPGPGRVRPRGRPAGLRHRPPADVDRRHGRPAARGVQGGGPRRAARPHPRAHGDRRRRHHRRRHRQAARHPRRGDAGDGVRRAQRAGAPAAHRRHRRRRPRGAGAQGAARRDAPQEGRTWWP